MNCRRVINSISAYVDGELTGAEMLEIRRHLSECPDCREEYDSIRQVKFSIAGLRTVTPRPEFVASIVSRLDEVSIPRYQRVLTALHGFATRKLSPVAAALAVSGVALAILAAGGQDRMLAVQNSNVVANAPVNLHVQNVSYGQEIPAGAMMYSNSRPLVVADQSREMTFTLVDMPGH